LAERLALNGHDVTVIAGEPHVKKAVTEEVNKVKVVRVPTYTFREAYHIPKEKETVKRLLQESFDVVHVNSIHAVFSLLPLDFKKTSKSDWKLVLSMHHSTEGYGFLRRTIWKLFWKRYVSRHLGSVDLVHATSSVEADIVSEHFPSVKNKIVTVGLGIEEDVLNHVWTGKNSDYLLYCGRLEKYKRVDLAVNATSYLVNRGHKIRLVIVGSGSFCKKIEKSCEKLADYIVHFPPKSRSEYLDLMSNARATISLSSAENFNLFLAEAYAMGVPLIATREAVAFCPELANVTDLAPAQVANAILKQISSNVQDGSGECALKPWNEVAQEFEFAYKAIL
nr:glycosyltransferase [archaeon]